MERTPHINATRLAAMIVLTLTSVLLVFTCIGLVAQFFVSLPPPPLTADGGASFLLLLSSLFIAIFAFRTDHPFRALLMNRSIWLGLILGAILGWLLRLTDMQHAYRWLGMWAMAFSLPFIIWGWLTGKVDHDPYASMVIATTALFCLFSYGTLACLLPRRTGRTALRISAALLAAVLSPLMIAIFSTLVNHLPALLTAPPGYFLPRQAGYYGLLMISCIMIFSQVALALVGGFAGALLGRFLRHPVPVSS